MRNWDNISNYEFEAVVGDLLSAELGVRFERFGAGADQGIDLRHRKRGRRPDVVQCKHYKGSRWNDLLTAAKRERTRLETLRPAPATYRFVTSQSFTPKRKIALVKALAPYIASEGDLLGLEDLEGLLTKHPEVERAHVKLWLASGPQLEALLRPGVATRSRALAERVKQMLPLYVQGKAFGEASEKLAEHHLCLLTGAPGIGKTTLAHILVADAIGQGYEPIEVSYDISEAWDAFDPSRKQIFLYDDFLGQTILGELRKNEESRLLTFMREVRHSAHTLTVLTTREYILQQAAQTYEAFRRHGLPRAPFLLALTDYTPLERAQILHNHVWHSEQLTPAAVEALGVDRGYRRIVEHRNFNPRVIEYITGMQEGHPVVENDGGRWLDFAEQQLDHPEEIWRTAYERHLGDIERTLLLTLATMPTRTELDDLREAFDAFAGALGTPGRPRRFDTAMAVLEDSFVATRLEPHDKVMVRALNPGLLDFLQAQLLADQTNLRATLDGARFFQQIMALWRLVENRTGPARGTIASADGLAPAAERLLKSKSAVWARFGRPADVHARMGRSTESVDTRLVQLLAIANGDRPPAGLTAMLERQMDALAERWHEGIVHARPALRIADMIVDGKAPAPDKWEKCLKSALLHDPADLDQWDAIFELHDMVPGLITGADIADLGETFASFAHDWLFDSEQIETEDEIDHLETLAERLDVVLASHRLADAREDVERRLAIEDAMEDQDLEEYRSRRAPGSADGGGDRAAMDAMFAVRN